MCTQTTCDCSQNRNSGQSEGLVNTHTLLRVWQTRLLLVPVFVLAAVIRMDLSHSESPGLEAAKGVPPFPPVCFGKLENSFSISNTPGTPFCLTEWRRRPPPPPLVVQYPFFGRPPKAKGQEELAKGLMYEDGDSDHFYSTHLEESNIHQGRKSLFMQPPPRRWRRRRRRRPKVHNTV